jgi:ABC-2 type transport system ATP-binding protein
MQPPAITLTHVSKRFGRFLAISDLSLEVARGEVLGFLGPNGAGKTTTIRLMTGFLKPDAGAIHLFGNGTNDAASVLRAKALLGYAPDVVSLDPGMPGLRLLDDLASIQGRSPNDRDSVVRALSLDPGDLRQRMGRLSRGTRQKINIVQALQHRPDLLILDESTEGLDPLAKRALFGLVRDARRRGAAVFFSTHVLGDVEELCDRVALIRRGQLVAVDSIAALRRNLAHRISVLPSMPLPAAVREALECLPGVTEITAADGYLRFSATDLNGLLAFLANVPLDDLTVEPPPLEEVFLRYYQPEDAGAD